MTSQVPLFIHDFIVYSDETEHTIGEITELDIPHPYRKTDTKSYIRIGSVWGTKLLTRRQIKGVLCPSCHPMGTEIPINPNGGPYMLEAVQGEVTNMRTGVAEGRWFRYCARCKYFKEAL